MLKKTWLKYRTLGILAALMVAVFSMSRYAESRKEAKADHACQSSPFFFVAPDYAAQRCKDADKTKYAESWVDTFAWPDGVTVSALVFTFFVIAWQAVETRTAAEATLKQAEIQAAGMKQWVDMRVTTTSVKEWHATAIGGDRLAKIISVHFSASNKTRYPLTIKEVVVYISRERLGEPSWEQYTKTEEIILAPKTDETVIDGGSMFDHNFSVPLILDVAQAAQYNAHTLSFSVTGSIRFKPAIGPPEDQGFSFVVKSGPNLTRALAMFTELKRGEEA
jgi:hypothetical protein